MVLTINLSHLYKPLAQTACKSRLVVVQLLPWEQSLFSKLLLSKAVVYLLILQSLPAVGVVYRVIT
jgi:hypothetical protein